MPTLPEPNPISDQLAIQYARRDDYLRMLDEIARLGVTETKQSGRSVKYTDPMAVQQLIDTTQTTINALERILGRPISRYTVIRQIF